MFLINSRRSRFSVASRGLHPRRHPLSRTYGVILQSSLTSVLPSALDYSSRLPVSVLVRLPTLQHLEAFLGRPSNDFENLNALELNLGYIKYFNPGHLSFRYGHFYSYRSLSGRRPSIEVPMRRRNIDLLSIVYAFRPRLRYRLTLGGITFPRNP